MENLSTSSKNKVGLFFKVYVEEVEINIWGEEYLQKMKEKYADINFDFAVDGMRVET